MKKRRKIPRSLIGGEATKRRRPKAVAGPPPQSHISATIATELGPISLSFTATDGRESIGICVPAQLTNNLLEYILHNADKIAAWTKGKRRPYDTATNRAGLAARRKRRG